MDVLETLNRFLAHHSSLLLSRAIGERAPALAAALAATRHALELLDWAPLGPDADTGTDSSELGAGESASSQSQQLSALLERLLLSFCELQRSAVAPAVGYNADTNKS